MQKYSINRMGKHNNSFRWVSARANKPENSINVSSKGKRPYNRFSPFSYDSSYQIPVPGQENLRSESVEGIWQGLKVINGMPDFLSFEGRPHKRRGKPGGHLFGSKLIGYVKAREEIYAPAYVYHVVNNCLDSVYQGLEERLYSSDVFLYDTERNGSIKDASSPYAHSALLAGLLNFLKKAPLPPFNKERFNYLHEQVDALIEYRSGLSEQEVALCDDLVTFAYLFSPDELKAIFALRAIKKGNIDDKNRLAKYSPTSKTQEPYSALRF